jgi:hypothetical protein
MFPRSPASRGPVASVDVGATVTIECKAYADKFGLPRCIDGFA